MPRLIQCRDCGNAVSKAAASCPNCGRVLKKKTSPFSVVALLAILLPLSCCFFSTQLPSLSEARERAKEAIRNAESKNGTTDTTSPVGSSWQPEPEDRQAKRKKLIEELIAEDVFCKVSFDGGTLPKAWVRPKFILGDYDTKQDIAEMVLAYYYGQSEYMTTLILKDCTTGKEVGSISIHTGARLKMK